MSSEAGIEDLSLDEAGDLETAAGEAAIYTSELRGSDEAGKTRSQISNFRRLPLFLQRRTGYEVQHCVCNTTNQTSRTCSLMSVKQE